MMKEILALTCTTAVQQFPTLRAKKHPFILQDGCSKGRNKIYVKPDSVVAGAKEIILKVLWKLVGIYVSVDDERNLRRASLALSSKGSDLGEVPSDATGEEIVLHVCMQVGSQLGIKVDTMCDLMDGRLLAGAWRLYNINAPDIRLYPGESLFMKVANAADSDLDIPLGLHHSIGLFAVLYLSRLFNIHELHVAASRIQKAYRSYRFFKALRRILESSAESQNTTKPLMATYVVEAPVKPLDVSRRRSQSVEVENGSELENALSKAREKIEGHEVTGERHEQEAKPSMPTAQVVKLQAIIRGFLARNRYLAMLKEKKALRDHAATVIQRFIRSFLARRCLARMRFRRVVERENAVGVRTSDHVLKCDDALELPASDDIFAGEDAPAAPSSNGVFECEETPAAPASDDVFFESEYVRQPAPSTSTYLPGEKPINLDRVLKLDRDLNRNEQLQKMCSNILEACERKLSEEDETASDATNHEVQVQEKPPVNELKKKKEVRIFTLEERTAAAVKIQAWYRGVRERQRLQKHLEDRREFMEAYRGNVANEEPSDVVDNVALSSRPVHSKIHDAVDMLFDPKMYVSKVGAFILNRLSALSPHLCAYLVVDAQGLSAILDIFEQKTTGRGPATAEILSILQEVFLRIVQCTHPAVVAEVEANLGDCVKIALHIFHAFYTNPVIVDGFGRAILALHRRPNAKKFFTKSKFYLSYATRRFNRLPQTDPRKTVLLEMKREMLSS
ncbi:hypothetical protein Q1695_006510 [Nippostrongylus brasiliensis]|nr:hypothetical protein Q1695_006510 [Nippostrongylus brasiliensis]